MNFKYFNTLATLLFFVNLHVLNGQIIADALPGCMLIVDEIGVECNGAATTFFGVAGNEYVVNNIDGSNCSCPGGLGNSGAYFEFEQINISSYTNVGISFDHSADPGTYEDLSLFPVFDCDLMPVDQSHDQMVFQYSLDGAAYVVSSYIHGTTPADFTGTWIETGLNGTTLQIRVNVSAKASGETFRFTNLDITGMPNPPDAGPDLNACPGAAVNLQGSGTGTWSGGAGVFGDVTSPTSTYTPDASESGSTVTLTYSGTPTTIACDVPYPAASDDMEVTVSFPDGLLQGTGILCPGECATVTVVFTNGTAPYILDLVFSSSILPIDFPFTIPAFDVSDVITVCYEEGGVFPSFDMGTNTLTLPGIVAGFSGSLTLVGLSDQVCTGVPQNSPPVFFSFLVKPVAVTAMIEACDDGSGSAEFDLTSVEATILDGQAGTVNFYDDMAATNQIFSPYYSPSATIYATVVSNDGCESDPVAVQLILISNGDAGIVTMTCMGETECVICDDDGQLGGVVMLEFGFENASIDYFIEMVYFVDGVQFNFSGLMSGTGHIESFNIDNNTIFQILSVTPSNDCIDQTDMPPAVEVSYLLQPDIDPIAPFEVCSDVTLPVITGTNLTGNEMYYTSFDGTGATYLAGDIIDFDITLFAFDGLYPECYTSEFIDIKIGDEITLIPPSNDTSCGFLILPPIPGQEVGSTVMYYTEMNGMGTTYVEGDTIFQTDSLFLFDEFAECPSNEPYFHINLSGTVIYDSLGVLFGCDEIVLPTINGMGITDSVKYYTEPNGAGTTYLIGDTVMFSDTLYMWDPSTQCSQDTGFIITNIGGGTIFDEPNDTTLCGSYVFPEIVGLNLGPNSMYFTAPNGGGTGYLSGDTIFNDSNVFIFDTTSSCILNQPQYFVSVLQQVEFDLNPVIVDCESYVLPSITGNNLTGSESYYSQPNGQGIMIPVGTEFMSDTIIYLFSGIGPCAEDLEVNISIEIFDSGLSNNYAVCSGSNAFLNLFDGILPPFTAGGEWSEQSTSFFDLTDPINVPIPNDIPTGVYRFAYTILIPGCPIAQSVHRVTITQTPNIGNDTALVICGNPGQLDLLDYSYPTGSITTYEYFNGSISFNNGIADISSLNPGMHEFYVISANIDAQSNLQCIDTTVVLLTLSDNPSAGSDVSGAFCIGSLIDLNDLIQDFDANGVFEFSQNPGALSGSELNTSGFNIGPVEVFHILPASNNCEADTASILLDIIDKPDAGLDVNASECNFGMYDLLDYITIADQSGSFASADGNYTLNGNMLDVDSEGNTTIYYILGDGVNCDFDSAEINLTFFNPARTPFTDTTCEATYDFEGTIFTSANNSQAVNLMSTIGCDSIVDVEITFLLSNIENIIEDICPSDTIFVNNIVYDQNNLTGIDTLFGMASNGCDSIINISLNLRQAFTSVVDSTTCDTTMSVILGGDVYDINNPSGITILPSSTGCDSIVTVNLIFDPFEYEYNIIQPECEDEKGFFEILSYEGTEAIALSFGDAVDLYYSADLPIVYDFPAGMSRSFIISTLDGKCKDEGMFTFDIPIVPEGIITSVPLNDSTWQLSLDIDANVTAYFWTAIPGNLDCWDCPDPILTGSSEVIVIYDYGVTCTNDTSIILQTLVNNEFHLPTAFSPNGDGFNNNFTIRVNEGNNLIIKNFSVFNRWGNQMTTINDYAPQDLDILWDGKFNGKLVGAGVYVYVIQVESDGVTTTKYGEITLLR